MNKDIENLKNILVDLEDAERGAIINLSQEEIDSLKTILNLTENQQKEIKKERNRIMELAELLDKQENEIKFLKGELEIQEGCSISKDKIRELKEKVEKEMISNPYDFSYMINEILEEN